MNVTNRSFFFFDILRYEGKNDHSEVFFENWRKLDLIMVKKKQEKCRKSVKNLKIRKNKWRKENDIREGKVQGEK